MDNAFGFAEGNCGVLLASYVFAEDVCSSCALRGSDTRVLVVKRDPVHAMSGLSAVNCSCIAVVVSGAAGHYQAAKRCGTISRPDSGKCTMVSARSPCGSEASKSNIEIVRATSAQSPRF